jgi:glycosyltransferase involved in cell wall biosynthesis
LNKQGYPKGVLYVATSEKIGGGNRVIMDLIGGLDRSRFAPCIVSPAAGPLVDWASASGVPWAVCAPGDWDGAPGMVRRAVALTPIIWKHRIHIVHATAQTSYRGAGLAARLTGAASVCHLGFPPPPGELEWSFRFGPDAVIACYEGQARDVVAMLEPMQPKRRVVAIPNGVNLEAYTPDAERDPRDWRFNARHVVAIVGHLSEVKGYPIFLEAAARISAVLDDCVFLAIGRDTLGHGYGDHLERRAREMGLSDRVKFLGWQSNVAEIVRQADVMVSPSLGEGFPLAVLEAMACGRPVVATTVGGVPEAVVDGQTGYLVPPGEVEPFVEATLRLLRDRAAAERMGLEGRRRVETHFSLTRFVNGVQSLYDELLEQRVARRIAG